MPDLTVAEARAEVWLSVFGDHRERSGHQARTDLGASLQSFEKAITSAYIPLVEAAEALVEGEYFIAAVEEGEIAQDAADRAQNALVDALEAVGWTPPARALVQVPGQQQVDTEQGGG